MNKKYLPMALVVPILSLVGLACAHTFTDIKTVMPAYMGQQLAYRGPAFGLPQADGNGQNYVADVTEGGWYTWPQSRLPIKVYIEDGTGTPGYQRHFQTLIRNAFDEWQRISQGRLAWQEVSSPRQASVICSWTAQVNASGNRVEAGETQTTIERNPFTGTGNILNAHVYVLTSLFGHPFSETDTYKTCLHEVGHALGLQGHSRTAGDIMFATLNPNQVPYLTQRDANTIAALYAPRNEVNSIAQSPGSGYYSDFSSGQPVGDQGSSGWSPGYNNLNSGFHNSSPWAGRGLDFQRRAALRAYVDQLRQQYIQRLSPY